MGWANLTVKLWEGVWVWQTCPLRQDLSGAWDWDKHKIMEKQGGQASAFPHKGGGGVCVKMVSFSTSAREMKGE